MPRGYRIPYEYNHKTIDGILHKQCNHCFTWLPCTTDQYYKSNNKTDGLYPRCIECEKKIASQWAKDNKEQHNENNRKAFAENKWDVKGIMRKSSRKRRKNGKYDKWLENNPEKRKQYIYNHRNHDITEKEWQACLKFFNHKCAYCGLPLSEHKNKYKEQLHKEHADHNGYNDVRNCVPACKTCNSAKWAFPLEEWYKEQEFFSEERLSKIYQWINEEYKKYIEPKPPYRITRKQNEGLTTYHWELWTVDEKRNFVECIAKRNKKQEIIKDIQNGIIKIESRY